MKVSISPDITITRSQNVVEILYELDGKIESVRVDLKQDIQAVDAKVDKVRAELKADIQAVDAKVDKVHAELKQDIQAVRAELKAEIQAVDTKVDKVHAELKQDIKAVHDELKADIQALDTKMTEKIDRVIQGQENLLVQIDRQLGGMQGQISSLFNLVMILIAAATLFLGLLPLWEKYLEHKKQPTPAPKQSKVIIP